jgi:hypothetical protein
MYLKELRSNKPNFKKIHSVNNLWFRCFQSYFVYFSSEKLSVFIPAALQAKTHYILYVYFLTILTCSESIASQSGRRKKKEIMILSALICMSKFRKLCEDHRFQSHSCVCKGTSMFFYCMVAPRCCSLCPKTNSE